MYSMVGSRINLLTLSLKDGFVNRNVFVKLGKLNLDIWGSIFIQVVHEGASFVKKKWKLEKKVFAADLTLKYRAG